MGATKEIAEWILSTKYSDFDAGLVKLTKGLSLNCLGGCLAGTKIRAGESAINYVRERGGLPEAGVIGGGFRTSVELAAFANGSTYHATELEDDSYPESTYMCGVLPGVFALGEKLRVSGKEIIEGIVVGWEPAVKLSGKCEEQNKRGLLTDSFYCCIGVAGMAAKMLKLGLEETTNALSIAASQSCGLMQQTGTGAHLLEAGFANRNGITAAMLAKQGATGRQDILECPHGLCYAAAGVTDLGDLELRKFRLKRGINMKKYPCCGWETHLVDSFLKLRREHGISADDVESIQVDLNPEFFSAGPCRYFHPANQEQTPFSVPHSIAACFLEDNVFLDAYTDEAARDPRYHAFREKVKLVEHPEWEAAHMVGEGLPITLKLKDGKEYKSIFPTAIESFMLSDEEIMDRYMDCALRVLPREKAKRAAKMTLALDEVKDVSELMSIITFTEKR